MTLRLSCILALAVGVLGCVALPGWADRPGGNPQDQEAIQKVGSAFAEAFQKGDATALAAFWASDGDYTDVSGRRLKGREAIEKTFKELFSEHKGLKMGIQALSLRFVTPDVAIEEGTSEVFPPDGGPPSRARYKNLLVKKEGRWLLSSVSESPFAPPASYEHLRVLEWALGEWAGATETGEEERVVLDWSANQNFIVGSFSMTATKVSVGSAAQWIGWDPLAKRIRSWMFDDSGGFGEGTWTKDGDRWMVKTSLVLPDGKKATATLLLSRVDADTITLQSKERTVDGKALPDTKEVRLKRVK